MSMEAEESMDETEQNEINHQLNKMEFYLGQDEIS